MRKLLLAIAATATLSIGWLVVQPATATTLPAAAGLVDARDAVNLTEDVHCRRYRHWHRWGYSRGCRVIVVRRHYRPHWRYRVYRRSWGS
jgi:hypothetical protein